MNNFNNMLAELRKMQLPIITVTNIKHNNHDRHLIIVPSTNDKITVFIFHNDNLTQIDSIEIRFQSAIGVYSQIVLDNPGSTFRLMSL